MIIVGQIDKKTLERVVSLFQEYLYYDYLGEMAGSIRSGKSYSTRLARPPGPPIKLAVAHSSIKGKDEVKTKPGLSRKVAI